MPITLSPSFACWRGSVHWKGLVGEGLSLPVSFFLFNFILFPGSAVRLSEGKWSLTLTSSGP